MRAGSTAGLIPVPVNGLEWKTFGSDGMLLDPASGAYAQIDEIGVAIWACVDGRASVDEITRLLATEFDSTIEDIADDVVVFLDGLIDLGLLSFAE